MGDIKKISGIPVMSAKLARWLLKLDYRIIDIKPNRDDNRKTVFIFEDDDEISNKIKEYTKNDYHKK